MLSGEALSNGPKRKDGVRPLGCGAPRLAFVAEYRGTRPARALEKAVGDLDVKVNRALGRCTNGELLRPRREMNSD